MASFWLAARVPSFWLAARVTGFWLAARVGAFWLAVDGAISRVAVRVAGPPHKCKLPFGELEKKAANGICSIHCVSNLSNGATLHDTQIYGMCSTVCIYSFWKKISWIYASAPLFSHAIASTHHRFAQQGKNPRVST